MRYLLLWCVPGIDRTENAVFCLALSNNNLLIVLLKLLWATSDVLEENGPQSCAGIPVLPVILPPVSQSLSACPLLFILLTVSNSACLILPIILCLSYFAYLFWFSYPGYPLLAVLSWWSCSASPALPLIGRSWSVLSQESCFVCSVCPTSTVSAACFAHPVVTVLLCLSRQFCPGSLFCLPCPGSPVLPFQILLEWQNFLKSLKYCAHVWISFN